MEKNTPAHVCYLCLSYIDVFLMCIKKSPYECHFHKDAASCNCTELNISVIGLLWVTKLTLYKNWPTNTLINQTQSRTKLLDYWVHISLCSKLSWLNHFSGRWNCEDYSSCHRLDIQLDLWHCSLRWTRFLSGYVTPASLVPKIFSPKHSRSIQNFFLLLKGHFFFSSGTWTASIHVTNHTYLVATCVSHLFFRPIMSCREMIVPFHRKGNWLRVIWSHVKADDTPESLN